MPTDELTAANRSATTITGLTLARGSSLRARVAGAAVTVALVVTGVTVPVAALSGTEAGTRVETAAESATPATFSAHVASFPDRIADHVGGVAARLHVGDVAAYLCGAGSEFACDVRATLDDTAVGTMAPAAEQEAATEAAADAPASGIGVR